MDIATPLFEGKLVRMATLDHEKDPEIESTWTVDPANMHKTFNRSLGESSMKTTMTFKENRLRQSRIKWLSQPIRACIPAWSGCKIINNPSPPDS